MKSTSTDVGNISFGSNQGRGFRKFQATGRKSSPKQANIKSTHPTPPCMRKTVTIILSKQVRLAKFQILGSSRKRGARAFGTGGARDTDENTAEGTARSHFLAVVRRNHRETGTAFENESGTRRANAPGDGEAVFVHGERGGEKAGESKSVTSHDCSRTVQIELRHLVAR